MVTAGKKGTVPQPTPSAVRVGIVKRCPGCGRRLYDKLTDCSGVISIKCPKCGQVSELNMAFRKGMNRR